MEKLKCPLKSENNQSEGKETQKTIKSGFRLKMNEEQANKEAIELLAKEDQF